MLLPNRYTYLIAVSCLSGGLFASALSVQAANCSGQLDQTSCGETENTVSWVFDTDIATSQTSIQQDAEQVIRQNPLVLASSSEPTASADLNTCSSTLTVLPFGDA